jgi:UDP-2,3-diacylglucosamine hydrolase
MKPLSANKMAPPDPVLLISDLHLEPARPDLTRAFFDFLNTTAAQAGALYILGDFFNVWIGDDDDAPLCGEVSAALHKLSDAGTAVYLMHGNRDFLIGETWAAACGATLIHEPYVLQQGDAKFLLLHGDALCTRDTDYVAFRNMVRHPDWQSAFLAHPLAERRAFADQARARSQTMSSNKPDDIMDVTPHEVVRVLSESGVTTLIHGHTHRPARHSLDLAGKRGERIVLGDWGTEGWYVRIAVGTAELRKFPIIA